ncbi:MAG: hypothetical protein ACRDRO_23510 [Pseudonocardiaceae bacterium]
MSRTTQPYPGGDQGMVIPAALGHVRQATQATSLYMVPVVTLKRAAVRLIVHGTPASVRALQDALEIPAGQAGLVLHELHRLRLIGPPVGNRPRTVLVPPDALPTAIGAIDRDDPLPGVVDAGPILDVLSDLAHDARAMPVEQAEDPRGLCRVCELAKAAGEELLGPLVALADEWARAAADMLKGQPQDGTTQTTGQAAIVGAAEVYLEAATALRAALCVTSDESLGGHR